jgi:hypothetical protein
MKQLLLICAVVALVGCGESKEEKAAEAKAWAWISDPKDPNNVKIEKAIRNVAKKLTGELTKADLEKVKELHLFNKGLTDVKGLEKLTQLTNLQLSNNRLTDVKGLENLTQLKELYLDRNKLTDVTGLENLTQLQSLNLEYNPDLTKEKIDELKKTVSGWRISHESSTNAEKIEKAIRNHESYPSFKKLTGGLTKADLPRRTYQGGLGEGDAAGSQWKPTDRCEGS